MPISVRKSVKISLLILGVTMLLLVLAPLFIDAGDFKPIIIRQAEQLIGRKVEIGDISASLFPWVGVRIDDVKIANREGFSGKPFLTVKSIDVEMALLPLFNRRIEIRRFVLDTPHLTLERNSHGVGNWQNGPAAVPEQVVGGTQPPAKGKPAGVGSGPAGFAMASLTAEAMNVHRGTLRWTDATTGAHTEIASLELSMDAVRPDSPIPVSLTGLIGGSGFSLEGQVGPVRDFGSLDPDRLPIQARLQAKGLAIDNFVVYVPRLAPYRALHMDIDAQFEQRPDGLRLSAGTARVAAGYDVSLKWKFEQPSADKLLLRSLQLTVNGEPAARLRGEMRNGKAGVEYEMRLSTPTLSRETLAAWFPRINTLYARHVRPWRQLQLGMLCSGDAEHLDVRDVQLLLDGELVQASGTVHFGASPDIRLRIAAGALHVSPWIPAPAHAATATQAEARPVSGQTQAGALIAPELPAQPATLPSRDSGARVATLDARSGDIISQELVQGDTSGTPEPDLRFLTSWRVAVQIQAASLFVHGMDFKHLRANLTGRQGRFELNPLTFDLSGGQVREHAVLNVARYPVHWTESSVATGVRLRPVIAALADQELLGGVAEFRLNLSGDGLLPEAALHTLSGSGNVRIRDGRVVGFDVPGMLQRLKMLGRIPGPRVTAFTQLVGSFVIHNGVVQNDDLFMASPSFRLTGHGRIDLTQQSMDYHIRPRLVGSSTGQGDTAGVRKGMTVPIHLVGPIAHPMVKLEMNIRDLMENAQGVIEELNNGGGAKGVRKVLQGIFPGL